MTPPTVERDPVEAALQVSDVHKSFGETHALAGLSMSVKPGSVLGVLGPNGAGKTTLVRILATLDRPDSGQVFVAGVDALAHPEQVRRKIGLSGQFAAIDDVLTARENLRLFGRLYGLSSVASRKRADELLGMLDLDKAADRGVAELSGGMRRRVDLACSLITRPDVLFLDEPTTGLDPRARRGLWDLIRELVRGGTTLLLTTQYLEEADQLADELMVINHGQAVAEGTPAQLKQRVGGSRLEIVIADESEVDDAGRTLQQMASQDRTVSVDHATRTVVVPVDGNTSSVPQAVRILDQEGLATEAVDLREPTLDEVFFALTDHHREGALR
ncbi:daunorubicin/doxorubicin resistance ABC transporter ATP-binding protein DrrA [Enemella evansiae]|nr:daunorubicin/doxorubicin resistance ABC transporter ATP-binding protein DrrA [Enemella evansiae]